MTGESVATVKFRLPAKAGDGKDERKTPCDGLEVLEIGDIVLDAVELHEGAAPATADGAVLREPPSDCTLIPDVLLA
jgi:hypothetical protein